MSVRNFWRGLVHMALIGFVKETLWFKKDLLLSMARNLVRVERMMDLLLDEWEPQGVKEEKLWKLIFAGTENSHTTELPYAMIVQYGEYGRRRIALSSPSILTKEKNNLHVIGKNLIKKNSLYRTSTTNWRRHPTLRSSRTISYLTRNNKNKIDRKRRHIGIKL